MVQITSRFSGGAAFVRRPRTQLPVDLAQGALVPERGKLPPRPPPTVRPFAQKPNMELMLRCSLGHGGKFSVNYNELFTWVNNCKLP